MKKMKAIYNTSSKTNKIPKRVCNPFRQANNFYPNYPKRIYVQKHRIYTGYVITSIPIFNKCKSTIKMFTYPKKFKLNGEIFTIPGYKFVFLNLRNISNKNKNTIGNKSRGLNSIFDRSMK